MGCFGEFPQILKTFLIKPSDKNFNNLVEHLMAFTQAHLYSLKYRGRELPDEYSNAKTKLKCLASDVITNIICKQPTYSRIFGIYKTKKITHFEEYDAHALFVIFVPAFKKLINQEISELRKEFSPQQERLRRQIGRAIGESCYEMEDYKTSSTKVGLKSLREITRIDNPEIPHELLQHKILEAFNSDESKTVPKWIKSIFNELYLLTEYQNAVEKYVLISTCIKVVSDHMLSGALVQPPMSGNDNSSIRVAIEKAQRETVELIENNHLQHYCDRNKISVTEKQTILRALENFLIDYAYDSTHDRFPTYFRGLYKISSMEYQKEYKNIIDTVLAKARKIFQDKLKNDPTIKRFGRYYIDM